MIKPILEYCRNLSVLGLIHVGTRIDVITRAKQIITEARKRGVILRLTGGAAIKLSCPSAMIGSLIREYPDIDVVGYSKQSKEIKELFTDLGYTPNKRFNALHGEKRLMFYSGDGCRIDVFLNFFEMCHKIDFRGRLERSKITIPMADLLLTKLQIVQLNEKDLKDIYCLLNDHGFNSSQDSESYTINPERIAQLCSDDWGLYKTVTINLNKALDLLENFRFSRISRYVIRSHLKEVLNKIEAHPKTLRWKLRAKIGEKVRWYDLPEEVA